MEVELENARRISTESEFRTGALSTGKATCHPVELIGISKLYGDVIAVKDVNIAVEQGEFLTLLGPSGSGKSTTLMLVAGFEDATAGTIRINAKAMTRVPPYRRGLGVVFQHYALFPHMTVAQNVAFPLEERGVAKAVVRQLVEQSLAKVQLAALADRRPQQLSGGQQQRVALARALIVDPPVLLMDEPLSALDKKLREEMQHELKRLQRELGITVISVTHDQSEALAMSDRIVVMRDGRVEQIGGPEDLYERPATKFVADFLGESNFLELDVVESKGNKIIARSQAGQVLQLDAPVDHVTDKRLTVSVRPEKMAIIKDASLPRSICGSPVSVLEGGVSEVTYLGETLRLTLDLGGEQIVIKQQLGWGAQRPAPGERVRVGVRACDLRILTE